MDRMEALAEAISHYVGYDQADSAAYQSRNPIALKAISERHERDAAGNRIFHTAIDGWQAAHFDLQIKVSGKSRTGLKPTSTLLELIKVYGLPEATSSYVAKFLRKALNDITISRDTPLAFFLE